VQDPNLAKLKQTKESNKHQQVQLQVQDLNLAKLNQTTTSSNRQTNEQEATSEPVNNICIFNDD
jgi:iron uptake system EfeUOB component EfeO/EfeM